MWLLVVGLGAYGLSKWQDTSRAPLKPAATATPQPTPARPIACRAPLAALSQGPGGCKALPAPGAGLLLPQPTAGSARLPDCRPNARGPLATALLLLLRPARAREPARMLCVGSRRRLTHLHQGGSPCRPDDPAGQNQPGRFANPFYGASGAGLRFRQQPVSRKFFGLRRASNPQFKHLLETRSETRNFFRNRR